MKKYVKIPVEKLEGMVKEYDERIAHLEQLRKQKIQLLIDSVN